jgi:hypothetical protein
MQRATSENFSSRETAHPFKGVLGKFLKDRRVRPMKRDTVLPARKMAPKFAQMMDPLK